MAAPEPGTASCPITPAPSLAPGAYARGCTSAQLDLPVRTPVHVPGGVHACAPPACACVHGAAALPPFPSGFFREMVFPREGILTLWSSCSPQDPRSTEQSKQQQPGSRAEIQPLWHPSRLLPGHRVPVTQTCVRHWVRPALPPMQTWHLPLPQLCPEPELGTAGRIPAPPAQTCFSLQQGPPRGNSFIWPSAALRRGALSGWCRHGGKHTALQQAGPQARLGETSARAPCL